MTRAPAGAERNSNDAAARTEAKAEAPHQINPCAPPDFRIARSRSCTHGQFMGPIYTLGQFMVPTGQLSPNSAIENKGSTYTPRPAYGSNRGQVMGIVTEL
jgi:hypothetical protein